MSAMTAQEIRSALAENGRAPNGPVRIARAEYLMDAAEAVGDATVYAQALLGAINAYEFGAEQSKMLVPFARLLRLWDGDAAAFNNERRHSLFWCFKWATSGMVSLPDVPLASIEGWLGEMESRYRQAGHSPRPVHMGRHRLARATGDTATAEREFEAWLNAPRDSMADCHACEAGSQGGWHAYNERDELALELWRPVLGGELVCAEEPHRVLAKSLVPLVRLGRLDEARANHLRGYRMARGVVNLRSTIALHIEFCALTGNEARGLEILSEHAAFLGPGAEDPESRLEFLIGALILLQRLVALGLGGLELADSTVADTAESAQAQITALCVRFDARNGTAAVSERTAQRLYREPLMTSLPLGSPVTLPGSASRPQAAPRRPGSTLDELVAEAQRLAELRHPQARQAWERVAALGAELPLGVAARVERSRAGVLMEQDPVAARTVLAALADRFAELGESDEALEARATAAFAAYLAGDRDTAESEAAVVGAEAEAAFAAGGLTARQYLGARGLPAYIAFNVFARLGESDDPAAAEAVVTTATTVVGAELAVAERFGEHARAAVYHRMLAQLAFSRQELAAASGHLESSRDAFIAAGQTWDASEPEALLAQLAMQSGDIAVAEHYAREALAHGGDTVSQQDRARFGSLLVEVLSRQRERQLDLVDAALRAADLWEGLSEPDALHNRFTAASAYASIERYAEAAALFDELMPRVDVPYDGPSIAMRHEQYGDCLTRLNEHRKAAEQYLAAAALVQDDPGNRVPHARVAWSAAQALQSAGLFDQAVPVYRRVAELWGDLGNIPARVRCLRSAAWLIGWESSWPEALEQMRSVLSELEAVPAQQRAEPIAAEIANTREQMDQMLAYLHEAEAEADDEDGDESDPSENDDQG